MGFIQGGSQDREFPPGGGWGWPGCDIRSASRLGNLAAGFSCPKDRQGLDGIRLPCWRSYVITEGIEVVSEDEGHPNVIGCLGCVWERYACSKVAREHFFSTRAAASAAMSCPGVFAAVPDDPFARVWALVEARGFSWSGHLR